MCLFFNSIKKPTSKIPFLFFLNLGADGGRSNGQVS